MRFLIIIFSFLWGFSSISQTMKIVVRRDCKHTRGVAPCSGSGERYWTGIQVYDWIDHDKNASTPNILKWSPCTKATMQNSGNASRLIETCTP